MVLHEDTIDQTFLLPIYIRKLILENYVCFFLLRMVDCVEILKQQKEVIDLS